MTRSHHFPPSRAGLRTVLALLTVWLAATPSAPAVGSPLPRAEAVPGGVAVVALERHHAATPPRARFGQHQVMVIRGLERWWAVVGLPLSLTPGVHAVTVTDPEGGRYQVNFTVNPKEYRSQHLTIKERRYVEPGASELERIRLDKQRIDRAFGHWSEPAPPTLQLDLPTDGPFSSPFGLRRVFNGQPRRPHSGLDIAAPAGTIVRAPADGTVVEVGDYFFNGLTVFLDHGQGLVTMYCHLSRVDVKVGQSLRRQDRIGAVGASGRVTGAHLHWSVSLNDTRVDPVLFLATGQPTP